MTPEKLSKIQEFNRQKIILANHPEAKSYEEALEAELGYDCQVKVRVWGSTSKVTIDNLTCFADGQYLRFRELVGDISRKDLTDQGLERLAEYESARHCIVEIIGKSLTLDRVLIALDKKTLSGHFLDIFTKTLYEFKDNEIIKIGKIWNDYKKQTLEAQTPETQETIATLLGWEE